MKRLEKTDTTFNHKPIKERIKLLMDRGMTRADAKSYIKFTKCEEYYQNDKYLVSVKRGSDADFFVMLNEFLGKCDYLSIKRHDKEPCHDWRDFQDIKNQLCGFDREGMEIYPREERMVDEANQYHMIVFPKDYIIPFGFNPSKRLVEYNEVDDGSKQRAYDKETRDAIVEYLKKSDLSEVRAKKVEEIMRRLGQ